MGERGGGEGLKTRKCVFLCLYLRQCIAIFHSFGRRLADFSLPFTRSPACPRLETVLSPYVLREGNSMLVPAGQLSVCASHPHDSSIGLLRIFPLDLSLFSLEERQDLPHFPVDPIP